MTRLAWLTNSIARRLTLVLGLIAFTVFGAIGALHYWALERELMAQERDELMGKAALIQRLVAELDHPRQTAELFHRLDDIGAGHGGLRVWIVDPGGKMVYGDGAAPDTRMEDDPHVKWAGGRILYVFPKFDLNSGVFPGAQMILAIDTTSRARLLAVHGWVIALISAAGFLATIMLAAYALRRGLRPVRRLARRAATIAPDTLSARLPTEGIDLELVEFAESFNRALDRVEAAYRQLEAFNADVAHELRTPLANLISGTQVALAQKRTAEELREVLTSGLEEFEHLRIVVSDMLFLARADRGERAAEISAVSLAAEAHRVAEFFEAALEERSLRIEIEGDRIVDANASLIRRALVNLVDNAIQYTPAEGTITIAVEGGNGMVRLRVRNPGETIAAADLPCIFDRFFRADPARAARGESQGLGLAIVRAIARMHGGDTVAVSRGGFTEVGFTLPA